MIKTKFQDIGKIAGEIAKIKNVKAVYLFGSCALDRQGLLSDIDLCIIGDLTGKERSEVLGYGSDNLDISIFDELPIYIKSRVLKNGKALVLKDKEFVNWLKIRTFKNYLDFKYIINRYCEEVLGCTI